MAAFRVKFDFDKNRQLGHCRPNHRQKPLKATGSGAFSNRMCRPAQVTTTEKSNNKKTHVLPRRHQGRTLSAGGMCRRTSTGRIAPTPRVSIRRPFTASAVATYTPDVKIVGPPHAGYPPSDRRHLRFRSPHSAFSFQEGLRTAKSLTLPMALQYWRAPLPPPIAATIRFAPLARAGVLA